MKRTLVDQFATVSKNVREEFRYSDSRTISYQYAHGLYIETYPSKATRITPGAVLRKIAFSAKDTAQIPATAFLIASGSKVAIVVPFCGDCCESGGRCNWIFCNNSP